MAYDEELAARVREALRDLGGVSERSMFGGLAFLVQGHMAVAAIGGGGLMVRVSAEGTPLDLLEDPHVRPVEMGGRKMKNWVEVDAPALEDSAALKAWVARGLATAQALPPK